MTCVIPRELQGCLGCLGAETAKIEADSYKIMQYAFPAVKLFVEIGELPASVLNPFQSHDVY